MDRSHGCTNRCVNACIRVGSKEMMGTHQKREENDRTSYLTRGSGRPQVELTSSSLLLAAQQKMLLLYAPTGPFRTASGVSKWHYTHTHICIYWQTYTYTDNIHIRMQVARSFISFSSSSPYYLSSLFLSLGYSSLFCRQLVASLESLFIFISFRLVCRLSRHSHVITG